MRNKFGVACMILLASQVFAEPDDAQNGVVEWPKSYVLEVHKPAMGEISEKAYLANAIQSLILDELAHQSQTITNGQVDPGVIEYPLVETHEKIEEDQRTQLVEKFPKPVILPLRIERSREIVENRNCSSLRKNRYHLISFASLSKNAIQLEVILCQNGVALIKKNARFDEQDMVKSLTNLILPIRKILTGQNSAAMKITTIPKRSSVYLDGLFLGKTPLDYPFLIPGKYKISIRKDGFSRIEEDLNAEPGSLFQKEFQLEKNNGVGVLTIKTEPAGAKVYLDADMKGRTPLKIENLPWAEYRVHLIAPEAGEYYGSVSLSEKNPSQSLDEKLTTFLKSESHGSLIGLRYSTWSILAFSSAALSFGTGIFFYVWRDQAKEEMTAGLSTTNSGLYTTADLNLINDKTQQMNSRQTWGTGFTIGAGLLAGLGIYFYIANLFATDDSVARLPKRMHDFILAENSLRFYQRDQSAGLSYTGSF